MAQLRLVQDFQGGTRTLPEGFTVNIDDVLLDDILSGRLKAQMANASTKKKAVSSAPVDKQIKGGSKVTKKGIVSKILGGSK